jgi:hypothetical protein
LVAVVVVAGLLNLMVLSATSHRYPYLAVARTVSAGQVIGDGDLKVVDLAGASGLNALPASQRSKIVGRAATVRLQEGSLVPVDVVGIPDGLRPGQALVALGLKAGQYPPGLRDGDRVMVVATGTAVSAVPAGGSLSSGAGGLSSGGDASGVAVVQDARVIRVSQAGPGSGSDEVVVSVAVDAALAPSVAGATSVGKASVVILGAGR